MFSWKRARWVPGILILLGLVGCLQTEHSVTLNPDGSGKVVLSLWQNPGWMMYWDLLSGGNTIDAFSLAEMLHEQFEGVSAWKDLEREQKGESIRFRAVAYFEDINELAFYETDSDPNGEGGHRLVMRFEYTANGHERQLRIDNRTAVNIRRREEQIERRRQTSGGLNPQRSQGMEEMDREARFGFSFTVPGVIQEAEGFSTVTGRTASSVLDGDLMLAARDPQSDAARQVEMLGGPSVIRWRESEVDDQEMAAFREEMAAAKLAWDQRPLTLEESGRTANEFEFVYSYLAAQMQTPEICEKIHPGAYSTAPFNPVGYQVKYAKSECYYHLALSTGESAYCSKVIPASHRYLDGSRRSSEECEAGVAAGGGLNSGGGDTELILRHLGYPDEQVDSTPYAERCFRYAGMMDGIFWGDPPSEFRNRTQFLPDFSTDEPDLGALLAQAREYDEGYRKQHINDLVDTGRASIHVAATYGNTLCIKQLLDMGASLTLRDSRGNTALHHAAQRGQEDTVIFLLQAGANAAAIAGDGSSALHNSAHRGNRQAVDLLLASGIEVDVLDRRGKTPLWHSAAQGHEAMSLHLMDRGADATAVDGEIVLQAVQSNSLQILKRLLAEGAKLSVVDKHGNTPLHISARHRAKKAPSGVVEFLLEQQLAVNSRAPDGRTPLHLAAGSGNVHALRVLLEHGADPTLKNGKGMTPLDYPYVSLSSAIRQNLPAADLRYLLDLGMSPGAENARGFPLLHIAVDGSNDHAVEILLERGVDPGVENPQGESALTFAVRRSKVFGRELRGDLCTVLPSDARCDSGAHKAKHQVLEDRYRRSLRVVELLQPSTSGG